MENIISDGAAQIALRGRDSNKKQNSFALYRSDGTLVDYGTVDADGAFSYEKPGQFYSIVSYAQTTERVDEGEQEPNDWNTDADLDRLRRAQYVIVADESVALTESIEVALKLDELDPDLWCVVIGAPPPQYVKGKTTFLLSDAAEDDQKTRHLKLIADSIVDKNDERVFILSKDLKGLLGTLAFPLPTLERVNRLITLSTPYEGRDEERAQELKRALAARRATPQVDGTDERCAKILPCPLGPYAVRLAAKFHTSVFCASILLLCAWIAKLGHHRGEMKRRGGGLFSPYIGVRLWGESSTGKTGLVDIAVSPLESLYVAESARRDGNKLKIPALKKLHDEANKRYQAAYLALEAANESADPDEIAKAEENERDALGRLGDAFKKLMEVDAPLHNYMPEWASDKGVDWELSQNEWAAKAQGKTPDGALVRFREGSDVFGLTDSVGRTKKTINSISRLLDVTDNTGMTVTHESASTRFGAQKVGCCVITEEQPGTDEAGKIRSIVNQGGPNRLFEVFVPFVKELPTLDDLEDVKGPWEALFEKNLDIERLEPNERAHELQLHFRDFDVPRLRDEARSMGDKPKAAFIGKLDGRSWAFARAFHFIKEAARICKGGSKPLELQMDADTMAAAIEYCFIAIEERDRAHEAIRNEKKEDNIPLSLDAQKMYQHQVKYARDQWTNRSHFSANAPTLNLWDKDNRERANAAEQELIDAGLWIIGQYGAKRNKRRAITLDEPNAITAPTNTGDDIPF